MCLGVAAVNLSYTCTLQPRAFDTISQKIQCQTRMFLKLWLYMCVYVYSEVQKSENTSQDTYMLHFFPECDIIFLLYKW